MSNNGKRRLKAPVTMRDDKGRLLPGSVLNPKGRPPDIARIKSEIAQRTSDLKKVLDFIVNTINDDSEKKSIRLKCAELLMAYALGRPQQLVDIQQKSINISINNEALSIEDDYVDVVTIEDL